MYFEVTIHIALQSYVVEKYDYRCIDYLKEKGWDLVSKIQYVC